DYNSNGIAKRAKDAKIAKEEQNEVDQSPKRAPATLLPVFSWRSWGPWRSWRCRSNRARPRLRQRHDTQPLDSAARPGRSARPEISGLFQRSRQGEDATPERPIPAGAGHDRQSEERRPDRGRNRPRDGPVDSRPVGGGAGVALPGGREGRAARP